MGVLVTADCPVVRMNDTIVGDGALSYAGEPPTQHIRISFGAINESAAAEVNRPGVSGG